MKIRAFLAAVVFFLISMYTSYTEVRYAVFGKTGQAAITKSELVTWQGRFGSERQTVDLEYRFTDAGGTLRNESLRVPYSESDTTDYSRGASVTVQYLSDKSRLAGQSQAWLTVPFIVFSVVLAVLTIKFWREYQEHERRKARA